MELDTASRQQSPRCDGHMLEKGLIGRRAPFEEAVGVYGLDTLRTSVVVFDFVIVPSRDETGGYYCSPAESTKIIVVFFNGS